MGMNCYLKTNQKDKVRKATLKQLENGKTKLCKEEWMDVLTVDERGKYCKQNLAKAEKISHPILREKLITMLITDQYLRGFGINNQLGKEGYEVHHDSLLNYNMMQLDSINQIKLKAIFAAHGFPTKSMVGKWGQISIQMILQHADRDVAFQKKYLPQFKEMVDRGEFKRESYAYLLDRILINEQKPQIYGTQQIPEHIKPHINYKPMEKPEEVNLRRMKMGMMPYEKYLELMKKN